MCDSAQNVVCDPPDITQHLKRSLIHCNSVDEATIFVVLSETVTSLSYAPHVFSKALYTPKRTPLPPSLALQTCLPDCYDFLLASLCHPKLRLLRNG